jgi:enamine deaminase RidA (YjgF/YER057c/UK114 family)
MSAENKLRALGLTLPPPPKPVASYVPAVLSGDLLFVSGMLPMRDGVPAWTGKLGRELSVEQGAEAAKLACLNSLAFVRS